MSQFILYREGVYNVWSTIVDAPLYECGMTLGALKAVIPHMGLEDRLKRAWETGCSGISYTLDICISVNRAGKDETELSREEFIKQFLTLGPTK